jgi:O-antigen ligase
MVSLVRPDTRLDSNQHRVVLREVGLRMIAAHPLLGVGPEQVSRQFLKYVPDDAKPWPEAWYSGHLHNIYLQYAAERGLPALAAFLWLVGKVLFDFVRSGRQSWSRKTESRFVLHAATAIVVGVLVGGWGEHSLGDSEVLTLFMAMIACGYVAAGLEPRENRIDVRHAA